MFSMGPDRSGPIFRFSLAQTEPTELVGAACKRQGLWNIELAHAACASIKDVADGVPGVTQGGTMQELCQWPGLILLEYADGFKVT